MSWLRIRTNSKVDEHGGWQDHPGVDNRRGRRHLQAVRHYYMDLSQWWQIPKGSGCEWAELVQDWTCWRLDALDRVLSQLRPIGGTTSAAPELPYWMQKSSGFGHAARGAKGTCRFCEAQPESPGSCFAGGCPAACEGWPTSQPLQSVETQGRPLAQPHQGSGRPGKS